MSGNVFFSPTPSCPHLFIHIPAARFSQVLFPCIAFSVPSVIHITSHCQSHTSISSHLLLFFMDTMKHIIGKLTTNGSL